MSLDGLFQSRRFWVSLAGVVGVIAIDQLKLPVSQEQIEMVVVLIGAWVVGDSLRKTSPKRFGRG